MSERDELERSLHEYIGNRHYSIDHIIDFILSDRKATIQKVVGPLTKYAGLSSHSGRVYADIDESLKLAKEVCK